MLEGSLFELLVKPPSLFVPELLDKGLTGSQLSVVLLSVILSLVSLVNLSVPLEDNPPALGVQYFMVRHC